MKNKETKYREEGGPRPGRVNAVKALNGTRAWRARGANSRAAPHGPRTEGQMASWEKEKCTKTRGRCLADHGAQRNAIRGPKRPFWVDKDRVERSRARVGSGAAARSVPRGEKAEEARRRRVINSQRRKPCRPTGHNGPPPRRRATRKRRPSGVVCANAETVKRQRERETRKKKKEKKTGPCFFEVLRPRTLVCVCRFRTQQQRYYRKWTDKPGRRKQKETSASLSTCCSLTAATVISCMLTSERGRDSASS